MWRSFFLFLPLLELWLLIEVGARIGGFNTVMLCLFSAAFGVFLIRTGGAGQISKARRQLARGEFPADAGAHTLLLMLAGVLFIIPGFLTDAAGLFLLLPPVRRRLIRRMAPAQPEWIEAAVIRPQELRLPK